MAYNKNMRVFNRKNIKIISMSLLLALSIIKINNISAQKLNSPNKNSKNKVAPIDKQFEAKVLTLIKDKGSVATIKTIVADSASKNIDCHQALHSAGRIATRIMGVEKAFSSGDSDCQSGWYHGVIEGFLIENGRENIEPKIDTLCSKTQNGFYAHQCHHGAGHGLMGWYDYELPIALEKCALMRLASSQSSCATGVYMENLMARFVPTNKEVFSTSNVHKTKYIKDDDISYPCNVVNKFIQECYYFQSSVVLAISNNSFEAAARMCQLAADQYKPYCYQSYGRDSDNWAGSDPIKAQGYCNKISENNYKKDCLIGAVQNSFWVAKYFKRAIDYCQAGWGDEQSQTCIQTVFRTAKDIVPLNEIRSSCQSIDDRYKQYCSKITK